MFAPEYARQLYEYNAWANRRMLDACGALVPKQWTKPLGSSFPSVRDTVVHIVGTEWVWLERWRGHSADAREVEQMFAPPRFSDLASVRAFWESNGGRLLDYVRALSAADLARRVAYRNTAGTAYESEQWEMLAHVVNHGSYHRGQVITMLRQLGAAVPSTDFIAWRRALAGAPER